jgi:hypothetical protein
LLTRVVLGRANREKEVRTLNGRRGATAVFARLSPKAKALVAEAGQRAMRGGPRSKELSNLTESVERGSRGRIVRHTRVDPGKVKDAEEMVRLGLAYVPAQPDKEMLSYVALTRLGEEVARLAAKSAYGLDAEVEARKYSTLDGASTHLSSVLHCLEHGRRTDRFQCFGPEERTRLKGLVDETQSLQAKVDAFRDSFGSKADSPRSVGPSRSRGWSCRTTRPRRP